LIRDVGAGPVGLDSSIFMYLVEQHPRYLPIVRPLFEAIDGGTLAAVTSALTLMEVLVVPLRAGNLALARRYDDMLGHTRGLRLVEIDQAQVRLAAQVRAERPKLRTPDALQLAAALLAGCSAFVTNDVRLPSIPGLRVVQLKDHAA
jgi:predicted nucleic acid-binding protein